MTSASELLARAAEAVGLDHHGAECIRDGSNVLYRLPGRVVARIGRRGGADTATREVQIARWLTEAGVSIIRPLSVLQPTVVQDRPVTWWHEIPPHRPATPAELGQALHVLHAVPPPTGFELPTFDPVADLDAKINEDVPDEVRSWLAEHLAEVRVQYADLPLGLPYSLIHGDAWQGNAAVPGDGHPVLLDLEHVAFGPPEWDLIPIAADRADFARITQQDYDAFAEGYGHDVTQWPGFRTLANLVELRWCVFIATKTAQQPQATDELRHRIACLRGDIPRPWTWTAF